MLYEFIYICVVCILWLGVYVHLLSTQTLYHMNGRKKEKEKYDITEILLAEMFEREGLWNSGLEQWKRACLRLWRSKFLSKHY